MSNDKNNTLADSSAADAASTGSHSPKKMMEGSNRHSGMDGSSRDRIQMMMDGSSRRENGNGNGEQKRRSSKILLEGVEYDLSNLLLDDEEGDGNNDDNNDDNNSANGSATGSSASSSDDSTSGYQSCRSKGSRGTMSRNVSNASSIFERTADVFEKQAVAARRQSPYRFDVDAMRTLMTSFRGIPELKDSFRLSKSGAIVELDEPSERPGLNGSSSSCAHEDELLLLANSQQKHTATALGGPRTTTATSQESEAPGRCSLSTLSTSSGSVGNTSLGFADTAGSGATSAPPAVPEDEPVQTQQQAETQDGIDDLVFDEATGTYVYREYDYTYPENNNAEQQQPHYDDLQQPQDVAADYYQDPCETTFEHANRYTLEEMTADAALCEDDGAYDDEEHEMEISPGVYVPFRGAKETWQAVATHTTHELDCFDCGLALVCINDCEFTVCPDCRVVNPVFGVDDPIGKPFGVGMGFKKEWVVKKQHLQRMEQERMAKQQQKHTPVRMQSKRRVVVPQLKQAPQY